MKTITTASYVFNSKLDKFYLKNLTATAMPYKLSIVTDVTTVVEDNTVGVPANSTKEIKITADGRYKLEIASSAVYFEVWIQLRNYILPIVEESLRPCCECKSTDDIDYLTPDTKQAIEDQFLYNLLEFHRYSQTPYSTVNWLTTNTRFSDFIFKANNTNRVSMLPMVKDQMMKAAIDGTAVNNPTLFGWYISFIYLGLYSLDKEDININDPVEVKALNTIYNYDIITSYIKKLGIDVLLTLNLY